MVPPPPPPGERAYHDDDPPLVLLLSRADLSSDLSSTVLWSEGIRRRAVTSTGEAITVARAQPPKLLVLAAPDVATAGQAIRELRAERATRSCGIVVLSPSPRFADEEALRAAGANVVLPLPVDPVVWNGRLDELLHVPPRRDVRFPTRLQTWSRRSESPATEATVLNLCVRGVLLEGAEPLEVGAHLDLRFTLPDDDRELRAVGQVVRQIPAGEGHHRTGVEFLVLRGDARARVAAFVEGRPLSSGPQGSSSEADEWESELRASEARRAAILDSALDAIVTIDPEGRVREFNRAAEHMFSYARAEVMGRPMAGMLAPVGRRDTWRHWLLHEVRRARGAEVSDRVEATAQRADGSELPVELTVTATVSKGHTLLTFTLRDVSDRKRIEKALACDQAITRTLAESSTVAQAAPRVLDVLCRTHAWDVGTLWVSDAGVAARCVDVWVAEGLEVPELTALDLQVALPRGTGLTGHAWNGREPVWIAQLSAWADLPRVQIALRRGLRSAVLVPLIRRSECLGVVELFSRERRAEDPHMVQQLAILGNLLAQFLDAQSRRPAARPATGRSSG